MTEKPNVTSKRMGNLAPTINIPGFYGSHLGLHFPKAHMNMDLASLSSAFLESSFQHNFTNKYAGQRKTIPG